MSVGVQKEVDQLFAGLRAVAPLHAHDDARETREVTDLCGAAEHDRFLSVLLSLDVVPKGSFDNRSGGERFRPQGASRLPTRMAV